MQFDVFNMVTVVQWFRVLDCMTCNHKVVDLNPTKLAADSAMTRTSIVI